MFMLKQNISQRFISQKFILNIIMKHFCSNCEKIISFVFFQFFFLVLILPFFFFVFFVSSFSLSLLSSYFSFIFFSFYRNSVSNPTRNLFFSLSLLSQNKRKKYLTQYSRTPKRNKTNDFKQHFSQNIPSQNNQIKDQLQSAVNSN